MTIPHQSTTRHVRYPGITLAARELKIDRVHLFRVLEGERKSPRLKARWNQWLTKNPQFKTLQK